MGFKIWLRGPADDPQVEVVGEHAWYWDSGHYSQRKNRSIMRELHTREESEQLQIADGVWFLPGRLP
jgi:hypothetical protein